MPGNTAHYFSYASNMSSKRLLQSCPTAKCKGAAKLKDHKFLFMGHKDEWLGAVANAVRSQGEFILGVVWEISKDDMQKLSGTESKPGDRCEHITEVCNVITEQSENLTCTYFRRDLDTSKVDLPSPQYLQLIIEGAIEHKLDKQYIDKLRQLPTNKNSVLTYGMRNALR